MSFDAHIFRDAQTGLIIDFTDAPAGQTDGLGAAVEAMAAIEHGEMANIDERRMVGHYWLRSPDLAPTDAIQQDIQSTIDQIKDLERGDHDAIVWIGIGGSGLGPQLVEAALRTPDTPTVLFLDNTDPATFQEVLSGIDPVRTLVVVVSKSGGTVETRNGLMAAMRRWEDAGEPFAPHAIAITGHGSRLWKAANDWRARVQLWDWVGGRTSVTGPVGGVLMSLCGMDFQAFLNGAAACDALTRLDPEDNPAALMAGAWHRAGDGVGNRSLVVEPYVDRYALLSRYLQQLVMESLGKRLDRQGREVHQGLVVYGNKGSTDQHAFVQQLRDGRNDAFVHFLETAAPGPAIVGADDHLASDHLLGFLVGTRSALSEADRPSLTLQVPDVSARSLGMLIALFERAVGLYAELVDINAYHQPGVEAGKKAATAATALLVRLREQLNETPQTAGALAESLEADPRLCWRLLHHLAASGRATAAAGAQPSTDQFSLAGN
ncbi:MAG: glucose-6-phosphate isomerase [Myxococcota bacterium]